MDESSGCVNESGVSRALEGKTVIKHWCRKQKTDSYNEHRQNISSVSGCVLGNMDPRDKDRVLF